MRISDWSSDVCSSDLFAAQRLHDEVRDHAPIGRVHARAIGVEDPRHFDIQAMLTMIVEEQGFGAALAFVVAATQSDRIDIAPVTLGLRMLGRRSEEHTSELQSLMRISYAVFCLKKKKHTYSKQTK